MSDIKNSKLNRDYFVLGYFCLFGGIFTAFNRFKIKHVVLNHTLENLSLLAWDNL
jgi:hypothetical protein